MSKSVLQAWVNELGLRHAGTLLTGVRGCDMAPKDDPSKLFVRCYRAKILESHCGDNAKARTFIEGVDAAEEIIRFGNFCKNCDHYPNHYIMHLFHCIEIVGYYHPDFHVRTRWSGFYRLLCKAFHVNPETREELDIRLNADEVTFAARDHTCDGTPKIQTLNNEELMKLQEEEYRNDRFPGMKIETHGESNKDG